MAKNYYKNPEIMFVNPSKYMGYNSTCGEGIKSYKEKRGVFNEVQVSNKIKKIYIEDIEKISGDLNRYGAKFLINALDEENDFKMLFDLNTKQALDIIRRYGVAKGGYIEGDFVILHQGVVSCITYEGSQEHLYHINEYNKQEELKRTVSETIDIEIGNVYDIKKYYSSTDVPYIYLGEYYMNKPKTVMKQVKENIVANIHHYIYKHQNATPNNIEQLRKIFIETGRVETTKTSKYHIFVHLDVLKKQHKDEYHSKRADVVIITKNLNKFFQDSYSIKLNEELTNVNKTSNFLENTLRNHVYNEEMFKENILKSYCLPLKHTTGYINAKESYLSFILSLLANTKENARIPSDEELRYNLLVEYFKVW